MLPAPVPCYDTRTLRLRLKDKHASVLREKAVAVNQVWNYCNALAARVLEREQRFLKKYDYHAFTAGAGKELGLHSQTVQAVYEEYATRRAQFHKAQLRWRKSFGTRRNLGWVPFKASALRYRNGQLFFSGIDKPLRLWDSYGLSSFDIVSGNFAEDARGRWYLNVVVKIARGPRNTSARVAGIDLGLTHPAVTSDGQRADTARWYRAMEERLARAQRANKKQRVQALHAKIKARRKDALHQFSTALVRQYGALFIGNVSSQSQLKSGRAKSALDAGWGLLRTMLQYKCDSAGVWFEEVNEAYSTVTCSVCNKRTGPSGLEGLRIREWACMECGKHHDRDVNAARNILALGLERLAGGILVL